MEDVKLRPVGTLACRCSAHARRPKRIFIGSHRGRLHAILAHAKRNFTPVTKWKLCASVFCINDSPPLDASSYFRFNRKRASERANRRWIFFFRFFFCSILVSCFFTPSFLTNEWIEKYSKIWEIVFRDFERKASKKNYSADDEIFYTLEHCWIVRCWNFFYKLIIWYAKKWISNRFLFFFFFSPRNTEAEYIYIVELCEFYSVFQFFFVEMLQLINIRTF